MSLTSSAATKAHQQWSSASFSVLRNFFHSGVSMRVHLYEQGVALCERANRIHCCYSTPLLCVRTIRMLCVVLHLVLYPQLHLTRPIGYLGTLCRESSALCHHLQ
jgi:hypothetical protein